MGQYFKFVNPAKAQYLDNPMSDNKWHNLLNRQSSTICILNYLLCNSGSESSLCGSWCGDAVYIAGDEGNPDSFGIATATKLDSDRNLYDKAEEEYQNLAEPGEAMLEACKSEGYGTFLVVNPTKKQFIDPLCFSRFDPQTDAVGDLQGLALASFYCRSEWRGGYFGSWNKDVIELVRSGTTSHEHAVQNYENVGYIAIEVLHENHDCDEDFRLLARINPRFIEQLRLSKFGGRWLDESNNVPEARRAAVLKQITTVAGEWSGAQLWTQVMAPRLLEHVSAVPSEFSGFPGAEEYIAGLKTSVKKYSEIFAEHSAEEILERAFALAQEVYGSDQPCGITFSAVETADASDEEDHGTEISSSTVTASSMQLSQGIPRQVEGNLDLRGRTDITNLPDGLSVSGDLILDACTAITELPEGLAVGGNLNLNKCTALTTLPQRISVEGNRISLDECTSLSHLPPGLVINGTLSLRGCTALTSLPEGLSVAHDLILTGCIALSELPEGLSVGQSLVIQGCKRLASLPEAVSIGGNFSASFSGITTLPKRLSVGGMVDLRNSPVQSLPESLFVGSTLSLDGCSGITKLPDELSVGGDLRLCGCVGIKELPEGITVKGKAYLLWCQGISSLPGVFSIDTLLLDGAGITGLPENLTISGTLSLGGCKDLRELPENLSVGDSLRLNDCTGLRRLPENLSVGRALILDGCVNINSIPYATVRGDLRLADCTGISELPDGLSVGGNLDVHGCTNLVALPEGLSVGGDLDASGCSGLGTLPDKFAIVGSLNLSECTTLYQLPDGLTVGGNLLLKGCSGLRALPENLSINGYLDLRGCVSLKELPKSLNVRDNIMTD